MKLILQGEDDLIPTLQDKWILFTNSGSFDIAAYLAMGYTSIDSYIVGAGGGGGGNSRAFDYSLGAASDTTIKGGGGGGGGGGGALQKLIGVALAALEGSNSVIVGVGGHGGTKNVSGTAGGFSIFLGATAYGGGAGRTAINANVSTEGIGGPGGAGGSVTGTGAAGGVASNAGGIGGVGTHGGGSGGTGAGTASVGHEGSPGTTYLDDTRYGGGGGGGGGKGSNGTSTSLALAASKGGGGGAGLNSTGTYGSSLFNGYTTRGTTRWVGGGSGGGGGGGVNLTALTGISLLGDESFPGTGGVGAYGAGSTSVSTPDAEDGTDGCVLIRLYK